MVYDQEYILEGVFLAIRIALFIVIIFNEFSEDANISKILGIVIAIGYVSTIVEKII